MPTLPQLNLGISKPSNNLQGISNTGTGILPTLAKSFQTNKGGVSQVPVTKDNPYGLSVSTSPLGVQAKSPITTPKTNTLPANQIKTQPTPQTSSSTENGTEGNTGILPTLAKQNSSVPTSQLPAPTVPVNTPGEPNGGNQTLPNVPSTYQGAVGGLLASKATNDALSKKAQDIAETAGKKQEEIGTQAAGLEGSYNSGAIAPRGAGLAQQVAQTAAAQQQAVAQGAQTALQGTAQGLTAQGQTQSAEQQAGSLTQPQAGASFFGSPESGNVVGSGQGGTGNTLIDNSLNNALGIIRSGGSTTDAMNALVGGDVAKTAFIQKMQEFDPNWNPTSSNAIVAANMQTAQKNIGAAADIQNSVTTLNSLANQIIPNMGTTGFNPADTPIGNQTFAQYFANSNPAATAGLRAGLGDIKNQISNVIASATGLTPSGVTGVTDSYDFTQMNPQQLSDFLQYINQYAQSNLQAKQKAVQGSTTGYGAYEGANASPGALPNPNANPTASAMFGTGGMLAKGLIGDILNQAGSAVTGAAAGLATKVLL